MTILNNKIVLDVDGILLDYITAIIEWIEAEKGYLINPDSPLTSYDMSSWFFNMTSEEFLNLVKEYNNYPRIIPPVESAIENVKKLKNAGYSITVLTSFGGNKESSKFRENYLNLLFPNCFDEIIILGLGECKERVLRRIMPKFFVDDADHNLEIGLKLGITCIALWTTYNRKTPNDAIYVETWEDISHLIIDLGYKRH